MSFHPYDRNQAPVAGPSRHPATAGSSAQAHLTAFSSPEPLRGSPSQKTSAFRTKLDTFYRHPALQRDEEGRCTFVVSRDNLLQSGYNEVMAKSIAVLKKLLIVTFHGELGDDAGGLSKEFFYLLSKVSRPQSLETGRI